MPDSDLRILLPLQRLIDETIRTTPVPIGGLTDDLAALIAVRACAWVGKEVLPDTPGMGAFVADVDAERQAQLAKWGEQHHPDGTAITGDDERAANAKHTCQSMARIGQVTWRDILWEEIAEALAETDPVPLRTELVQCAAVIQAWIADIDGRTDQAAS